MCALSMTFAFAPNPCRCQCTGHICNVFAEHRIARVPHHSALELHGEERHVQAKVNMENRVREEYDLSKRMLCALHTYIEQRELFATQNSMTCN